jgi:hypothetical protein
LNEQVLKTEGNLMMAAMSLFKSMARVMLGAAGLASWVAVPFFAMLSASAGSLPVNNRTAIRKADQSAIEAYNKLPLTFDARPNNSTAKLVSRGNGYDLYLSSTEAVFQLQAGQSVKRLSRGAALGSPRNAGSPSAVHKLPEPLRDEVASRSVQLTSTNIQSSIVKQNCICAFPNMSDHLPGKRPQIRLGYVASPSPVKRFTLLGNSLMKGP